MKNITKTYSRGNEPKIEEDLVFVPDYKGEPWLFRNVSNSLIEIMKDDNFGQTTYMTEDTLKGFQQLSATDPLGKMPEFEGFLYSNELIVIFNNSDKILLEKNQYRDKFNPYCTCNNCKCKDGNNYFILIDSKNNNTIIDQSDKRYKSLYLLGDTNLTYQSLGEDKYVKLLELINLK